MTFIYLDDGVVDVELGENSAPPILKIVLIDKAGLAHALEFEGEVLYQLADIFRALAPKLPRRKGAH